MARGRDPRRKWEHWPRILFIFRLPRATKTTRYKTSIAFFLPFTWRCASVPPCGLCDRCGNGAILRVGHYPCQLSSVRKRCPPPPHPPQNQCARCGVTAVVLKHCNESRCVCTPSLVRLQVDRLGRSGLERLSCQPKTPCRLHGGMIRHNVMSLSNSLQLLFTRVSCAAM